MWTAKSQSAPLGNLMKDFTVYLQNVLTTMEYIDEE